MLWSAFGINRPDLAKRTAPSARNWQEIEIYALTAQGAYLYDPFANKLRAVLRGDRRQAAGMQGFVATAPLVLIYVADSVKMGNVSPADGKLYAGIDTGFISQNVYLFCASEGLGTVVLGNVDRKALAAALELSPRQSVVLTQPVGYPTQSKR
jgi:SagB-type dehydrogenase family enzyme